MPNLREGVAAECVGGPHDGCRMHVRLPVLDVPRQRPVRLEFDPGTPVAMEPLSIGRYEARTDGYDMYVRRNGWVLFDWKGWLY